MRQEAGPRTIQGPVARIRTEAGAVCGTGVLIGERHVMTCAHVIDDAIKSRHRGDEDAPTEEITLDLPFLERRGLTARIVAWHPMPMGDHEAARVSDIAVLELETQVPGGLDPREAVLSAPPSGTAFTTLGFPAGMDGGAEAQGELRMRDAGGWRHVQDTQDHGYFVAPGFSGAPVFDAEAARHGTRRLLGMVVAVDRDAAKRLAFVIPTPTLGQGWPLLVRPYKGLDAFEAEDADLFFGRREKVDELAAKIERCSFVALIGPSGSGKSSLVRAGLVPRLRARGGWATATFKPRNNPLYQLAEALAGLSPSQVGDGLARRASELAAALQDNPRHILDYVPTVLGAIPSASRLLLVIDQFEELFTLAPKPSAIEDKTTPHGAFAAVLDAIASQPFDEVSIRVIATLRADFTGHALRHGVFERLMTDADVLLGPMSPADLTEAVARPAERFDVAFDPGLVSEIVATMRDSRGGLPLMQFALDRLWQVQSQRRLTQASYDAIGGVEGAVNDHAEAFRQDLGPDDQIALRRIMTRLVNLADPGTGSEDTRAVATRDAIGEADWALVGRLAKARLVTTGGGTAPGTETSEIAHEALIRAWTTLRTWLDEDRTFALWRQRLRHDIERWDGSNDDALLRGALLAEAEAWLADRPGDLNKSEREYIKAGVDRRHAEEKAARSRERDEAEKERRRREERFRFLAFTSVTLASLLIVVGVLWLNAADARDEAEAAAREALGRQLAAEAKVTAGEALGLEAVERAAALAIEAWKRHRSSQAYQVAAKSMRDLPIARIVQSAPVSIVAYSPDDTRLATVDSDGVTLILEAKSGKELARIEHVGPVNRLAFNSDGTRLATTTEYGKVIISDARSGREIARISNSTPVWALAYSPTGTRLSIGNAGGTLRVLDAETGEDVARVQHGGSVLSVAYSPDGTRIATGSRDGTALILDAETGEELTRVNLGASVHPLAFSPNGTRVAAGVHDGTVRIFDSSTGVETAHVDPEHIVNTLAFSPDGASLAIGRRDGTARILDTANGNENHRIEHDGWVRTLAFSPDGTYLATGSDDGTVRIVDAATGEAISHLEHQGAVEYLAYSHDGTRLATGSQDNSARIFDVEFGPELSGFSISQSIEVLAYSPNGKYLALGSSDNTSRILDAATSIEMFRIEHRGSVLSLAFSPDSVRLASGSRYGFVRLIDPAAGREIARVSHDHLEYAIAFSPDGTRLATAGQDNVVQILNAVSGEVVERIENNGAVRSLVFSLDGTRLATATEDGTVRIINTVTREELARLDHGVSVDRPLYSSAAGLTFNSDGTRLAIGDRKGTARILDAKTGVTVALVKHDGPVNAIAFSPDGTRLATGGEDGTARILDAETGEEFARLEHGGPVWTLAYNLDGTRLATGSEDGTARVIDAETGEELARADHGGPVNTLAFTPDGTRFATGGEDGTARIFDADPAKLFRRLCTERAGRNLTREEWRRYIGEGEAWRETCPEWRTVDKIAEE